MTVQEIYDFVALRVNKIDNTTFFNELKAVWGDLWYNTDLRESVCEMELEATNERQITLPWFVLDVKGIRDYGSVPLKLASPRPYYNLESGPQSDYEWRLLHRTPLMRPLAAIGRLTFKARRAPTRPIALNVRGPGDYGVTEVEQLTIPAGQRSVESVAVYSDLTSLSKTATTDSDIEVFDIQDNQVAILPADQTDVWCQLCQLVDSRVARTGMVSTRYYTVLFKKVLPALTAFTDSVPTEYGIILQQMLVSSILGGSKDENDRKVADRADQKAAGNISGIASTATQQHSVKLATGRSPFYKYPLARYI